MQKSPAHLLLPDCKLRSTPLRVAIVDDEPIVSETVELLLEEADQIRITATCASGQEALEKLPSIRPHVVLMDIRMPGMGGLECARGLKKCLPETRIVMLTAIVDAETVAEAIDAGADFYLAKPFSRADLIDAILQSTTATRGEAKGVRVKLWRPAIATPASSPANLYGLTEPEATAMNYLAGGRSYKEIADLLSVSESKAHKVINRTYRKLGVHTRLDAVRKWQRRQ